MDRIKGWLLDRRLMLELGLIAITGAAIIVLDNHWCALVIFVVGKFMSWILEGQYMQRVYSQTIATYRLVKMLKDEIGRLKQQSEKIVLEAKELELVTECLTARLSHEEQTAIKLHQAAVKMVRTIFSMSRSLLGSPPGNEAVRRASRAATLAAIDLAGVAMVARPSRCQLPTDLEILRALPRTLFNMLVAVPEDAKQIEASLPPAVLKAYQETPPHLDT